MSEQLRESLSAAMDNEADAFELRRVLDEAKQDDELREQWHRLHLMRDIMREEAKTYQPDLRDAIFEKLNQPMDEEHADVELSLAENNSVAGSKRSPWMGRVTGTAVAAAVAVAVIFTGGVFDGQGDQTNDFVGVSPTLSGAPADSNLVPVMYQQATKVDQQRQNALMLLHYQQNAMNQPGVTSFVKMATFSTQAIGTGATTDTAEEQTRQAEQSAVENTPRQ